MSDGHVHVTQRCEHGTRAGGCKCLGYLSDGKEKIWIVPCPPNCPETPGYRPTWDDVHMGEPDT